MKVYIHFIRCEYDYVDSAIGVFEDVGMALLTRTYGIKAKS
jgi:hypothetical protein